MKKLVAVFVLFLLIRIGGGYGMDYGSGMYKAASISLNIRVYLEGTKSRPSPFAINRLQKILDNKKSKAKSEKRVTNSNLIMEE